MKYKGPSKIDYRKRRFHTKGVYPTHDTSRMGQQVVVIQALYGSITTRQKNRGTFSMNCRERGSHARGVYPTQNTSRMETARVKQEIGTDKSVIVRVA